MMKRRRLLGLTASAGTVGVLGSGFWYAGQPSPPAATYADEPVLPGKERTRPVVGTDTTTAGRKIFGTARQHASVVNLEPTGRYALVTEYQLIPGSNYNASSGWKTNSLTVDHSWRTGSLVSHPGDIVPAEDGDTDSGLRVSTTQSTEQYRWNVTFDPATGNSLTFRFATVVDYGGVPETGDTLVDATFGAGFTKGVFGGSKRDMATAHLMMRGTSD